MQSEMLAEPAAELSAEEAVDSETRDAAAVVEAPPSGPAPAEDDRTTATAAAEAEPSAAASESGTQSFLSPLAIAAGETSLPGVAGGVRPAGPIVSPRRLPGRPQLGATSSAPAGLFGIEDRGRRIVYVIDRSASMGDFGTMRRVKAELAASLSRLKPDQRFQILFYNSSVTVLDPPAGASARAGMFRGDDRDRGLAMRGIRRITPAGGTEHAQPLLTALAYQPDVVFFLTDGEKPGLSLAELDRIVGRNAAAASIHCIQFGQEGPVPGYANFLQRLSARTGGEYLFRKTGQD